MMNKSQAVAALGSLAQETRLSIVRLLVVAGQNGLPAGKIGAKLGIASSRLSFHLSRLEAAGIVTSENISRMVIYRASFAALGDVIDYLLVDCCGNDQRIRSICCNPD